MTRRRQAMLGWGAGAVGAVALVAGAAASPDAVLRALHPAALFWTGLSVGALPVLLTGHLTGGAWADATGGLTRAVAGILPVGLVAWLLLLLVGMPALFPWTRPVADLPEVVRHKTLYLNIPFFAIRSLVVFAAWAALAAAAGAWRRAAPRRRPGLAAGGLVVWLLATTVFAFDWLMSLEPAWYSDIFGMVVAAGFVVSAMAAVVALAPVSDGAGGGAVADFVALWLAVILGWVFVAFSQYLIIWMGNLPDEAGWYLHRGTGTWRAAAWATFALFALAPVVALLHPRMRRPGRPLRWLAAVVLAGNAVQCVWLTVPSFPNAAAVLPWHAAAWLALGGPALAMVASWLPRETAACRRERAAHG